MSTSREDERIYAERGTGMSLVRRDGAYVKLYLDGEPAHLMYLHIGRRESLRAAWQFLRAAVLPG